jgi:hypothetical protein
MSVNKKRTSASDVLRQEMQQPLVIPARDNHTAPNPTPTPNLTTTTNMNSPTNDDAQNKAAQEKEAKLQQQKFDALTKELNEAKAMIVKLAEQGQAPAKGKAASAIVKKDTSHASLTARPTQSREETIRRRNNTDIGWLD